MHYYECNLHLLVHLREIVIKCTVCVYCIMDARKLILGSFIFIYLLWSNQNSLVWVVVVVVVVIEERLGKVWKLLIEILIFSFLEEVSTMIVPCFFNKKRDLQGNFYCNLKYIFHCGTWYYICFFNHYQTNFSEHIKYLELWVFGAFFEKSRNYFVL